MPPTTSFVCPGVDGELVYVAGRSGNKISDFSNAGYMGREVSIPHVQARAVVVLTVKEELFI